MSRFITDIAEQTITIEGRTYTADDATASDELPSALQTAMREQYGKDSFMADLSDFLSEWFNEKDTITVYSSGSTGAPKEMQVEKQRMMNSAVMTVSFLDLYRNDTALLCMPLRYIAGKMVVVRALVAGLNLIVVEPCGHPMSKVKEAPAFAALIPMQVYNSMQNTEEKEKLMGIKQLIIGGGPVDEALSKELCDFPNKVWSTYGMTETLSHIALRRLNGKEASEWYTPLEGITVSASQEGALLIDAPQLNAEPLQTNDLVEFNAAHQFRILGRKDNIINTGGVKFDLFSPDEKQRLGIYASAQHIDRDSYYGGGEDLQEKLKSYGNTTDMTWVAGAQYNYNFDRCLFMPATLTAGAEYNQDRLKDNMWGRGRYLDQRVNTVSAFAQNEWKTARWSFLVGARMDKHSLLDKPVFSPRANVRFNPTDNINLRASYSFGFRAPQAFDEDLHIDNVGGTVSMIQLAKDLKEEKSQSLSLSADMYHSWGDWQGNLLAEGFYTNISDVFALTEIGKDENGVIINERGNEKGAVVYGCTLEGKLAWRNVWQLQAGFTVQQARYKEARSWSENDPNVPLEKRMFRTPDTYGYFTMSYNPLRALTLALSGTYTGSMLVEHHAGYISHNRTETTRRFVDMGFKAAYDFKFYKSIQMQVSAGVQNLLNAYQQDFDRGANRDSGYIYGPGMPRSVYAVLKLSY